MFDNISVLYHSCVKIFPSKVIYTDPYGIKENFNDADYIFITHSHYDHFSVEDIMRIRKLDSKIVITGDLYKDVIKHGFKEENIITVKPNNEYNIENIKIKTVPAYNRLKPFHLKNKEWVGYIIGIDGINYYIAGDTDLTSESEKVKCDVAFVPVGGTYTMNSTEAAKLVNIIKPKLAIPIHYGSIVGTRKDAEKFENLLDKNIECKILL